MEVPMNISVILKMIQPWINKKKQMTYDRFEKVFSMLDRKEQYEVINVLRENGVELVDVIEEDISDGQMNNSDTGDIPIFTNGLNGRLSNEHLCLLYQQGDKRAADLLVEKNSRLIYKYALYYSNRYNHKLEIDDLVQSGAIGLLKAAELFDRTLEYKLTTYADSWIKQCITRTIINEGFTIRIPVHLFEVINKITNIERNHNCETVQELIELVKQELDMGTDKIIEILKIRANIIKVAMLNQLVGEEEDSEWIDFIRANDLLPEDEVFGLSLKEQIEEVLESLTAREEKVLRLRFGLDDGRARTLEEVGVYYGVTRERIRQIEAKALRKLRHPSRSKKLIDYLA